MYCMFNKKQEEKNFLQELFTFLSLFTKCDNTLYIYRVRREKAEKLKKLEALGLVQPGKNMIFFFISYGTRTHLNWKKFDSFSL